MTDVTTLLAELIEAIREQSNFEAASAVEAVLQGSNARLASALDAVTALHKQAHKVVDPWARGFKWTGNHCSHDGDKWPCPTITAVVAALGGGE